MENVMYEPLLKLLSQKIFVSVEITRSKETTHNLVIHNQSEFTVELIRIEVAPPYPIGFGASGCISDTKIFKNQQLIPGQKITFQIDKNANKNIRQEYNFTAIYKTYLYGKVPPQKEQNSNTFKYCATNYTVPLRSVLEQN
jgi:hypothetical protein